MPPVPSPTRSDLGDERAAVPGRMYRLLTAVAATAAVMLAVWLIGDVLMMVFASALLAVILHGLSARVVRWAPLPYWAALTVVSLAGVALLVGLGFKAGPGLADQVRQLREALTGQAVFLRERLAGNDWGRAILDQVPSMLGGNKAGTINSVPFGIAGSVAGYVGATVGVLGTLAVVLITSLYFAASPGTYVNGALRLVPERHRADARTYAAAAGQALWAWSAGQALDMLVVGILSGVGLWLIGVPLALVLGVVAGLLNFVPYIGAIVGAVPAVILAFSVGSTAGLETIVLYLVIQGFEGNVMAPLIQKHAVQMPPGVTILAQTVFGSVLGLPGLIFATPLTAALLAVMGKATNPLRPEHRVAIEGDG